MIESLVGYLLEFIDFLSPLKVINEYEHAIHLRRGLYLRTAHGGVRWKLPIVDAFAVYDMRIRTTNLVTQKLTSSDMETVLLGVAIRWRIVNPLTLMRKAEDYTAALDDSTYGEIAAYVVECTWEQLFSDEWMPQVLAAVSTRASRFGIEVLDVWRTDLVHAKVLCIDGIGHGGE